MAAARAQTKRDTTSELLTAMRELDLASRRFRTVTAQRWGVTVADSLILSTLAAAGNRAKPSDLAKGLMISSGTMTTMLDRLEAAGYVRRAPNPDDRRSLIIELTKSGADSLFYDTETLGKAVESAVPKTARTTVRDAMLALARALDEAAHDGTA